MCFFVIRKGLVLICWQILLQIVFSFVAVICGGLAKSLKVEELRPVWMMPGESENLKNKILNKFSMPYIQA